MSEGDGGGGGCAAEESAAQGGDHHGGGGGEGHFECDREVQLDMKMLVDFWIWQSYKQVLS